MSKLGDTDEFALDVAMPAIPTKEQHDVLRKANEEIANLQILVNEYQSQLATKEHRIKMYETVIEMLHSYSK